MRRLTNEEVCSYLNKKDVRLLSFYVKNSLPLLVECKKCKRQWKAPFSRLQKTKIPCVKCAKIFYANKYKLSLKEVQNRVAQISPNIIILSTEYIRACANLKCKCLKCGYQWNASYNNLVNHKRGCHRCKGVERLTYKTLIQKIAPSIKILKIEGFSANSQIFCECSICAYRWQTSRNALTNAKTGCPRCAKKESKVEIDFLNTFEGWTKDRKILNGKELDAYFAKEKLAIEINGCYWHSTSHQRINKNYHLDKTNICESKGIKLLHFWDFEIKENFELCRQIVLENLNEFENLKDFEIRETETLHFELYDSNGFKRSNLKLKHIQPNSYEIVEFNGPNKQNLYDFFVLQYRPSKIVAKLNRRFFSIFDNYALKLGFKLVKITKPSYFKYHQEKRYSKHCKKNYPKCYDCGELIYESTNPFNL